MNLRDSAIHQNAGHGASPDDDSRWLDAAHRGDIAAFERLFRAFAADLVAFAESYVDSEDEAEEVVHVVFCWLWEHRFTLERPKSARAYLFAAVRNRALNAVRDKRTETAFRERVSRAAQTAAPQGAPAPDSELASRDIEHALAKALREMPVRCREVYTLIREQGFTYAEVADALGIAPKTVEIHMSRSLAILRQRLAPWLNGG